MGAGEKAISRVHRRPFGRGLPVEGLPAFLTVPPDLADGNVPITLAQKFCLMHRYPA